MFEVVSKKYLNSDVVMMKVLAPFIAKKAKPGQFIIFRVNEIGERIPLTIADYDIIKGTVTIIFQTIGKSTKNLSKLKVGDYILDFVGPLGKESELSGIKKACIIGGGVGCAIAYPQAKALYNMGCDVTIIAGFKNKEIVILEKEMEQSSQKLIITTDDGSYGKKGFVTNALEDIIENGEKFDTVIAIGPIPMMKFVSKTTEKYGIKTIVSLNPIMIDATGMCGCCRVSIDGETKFACIDGPDFDAHLVDFDELEKRNKYYKLEEKRHDNCNLLGGL